MECEEADPDHGTGRQGGKVKTLLGQHQWMRRDAAAQLESLESRRTRVPKHLPDGDIADGTSDQIAPLRQTITSWMRQSKEWSFTD